jgi:tetratricopeptide (TPR) repeat protein
MAAISKPLEHHLAGRLELAIDQYQRLIALDADNAEAWHYLGVASCQMGNHRRGADCIAQSIQLNPACPEPYNSLGNARKAIGEISEAVRCYQRAISLRPAFAEAHYNLALAMQAQGQLAQAIEVYREALRLQPAYLDALLNLAIAFQQTGRFAECVSVYQRALELSPGSAFLYRQLGEALRLNKQPDAASASFEASLNIEPASIETLNSLALAHLDRGRAADAVSCLTLAIQLAPSRPELHDNLGLARLAQGNSQLAIESHRTALRLQPTFFQAWSNLGSAQLETGELSAATESFLQAIACEPNNASLQVNLALAYEKQSQFEQAELLLSEVIEREPNHLNARWSRALLLLHKGDFERGWQEHEWRWKYHELPAPHSDFPLWDGRPLDGRTLLVHAEQGLGDTIQFVRYLALFPPGFGNVIFDCQESLVPLLRHSGTVETSPRGSPLPLIDVQAPLLSLPLLFKTTLESIPKSVPYLTVHESVVDLWASHLASLTGFKVGIAWQGSAAYRADRERSIPLRHFQALGDIDGVTLISLQKGHGTEQIAECRDALNLYLPGPDVDESRGAFIDTAAIMKNLDLVITSDTAIAHLAGGLGIPVWVALPFVSDWRWLRSCTGSPWYPTMRLFRQKHRNDWANVFQEIELALRSRSQP